ncbi:hypothetical protein Tco_0506450 [Tanacetum coccineum]
MKVNEIIVLENSQKFAKSISTCCGLAQPSSDNYYQALKTSENKYNINRSTRSSASYQTQRQRIAKPLVHSICFSIVKNYSDPEQARGKRTVQKNLHSMNKVFQKALQNLPQQPSELLPNSRNKTEDTHQDCTTHPILVDSGMHKAHDPVNHNLCYFVEKFLGLPKLKYVKDQLCSSCEMSKAKRSSFKSKAVPSSKGRLNLLHMDLCGPGGMQA